MSPFPGNTVPALPNLSVNADTAAAACAHDDSENKNVAFCLSLKAFRQRKTIGIILHRYPPSEKPLHIALKGLSNETDSVGVMNKTRFGICHAGDSDTDGIIPAQGYLCGGFAAKPANRIKNRLIAFLFRRGYPFAIYLFAGRIQKDTLCFCSAEIYADFISVFRCQTLFAFLSGLMS
jgi:hypothetical protein